MTTTDAPVTVEQIDWVERFAKSPLTTVEEHDAIMKVVRFARHRLAALASAPPGVDARTLALVIAAREFWDIHNDLSDESRALDKALEPFSASVPYADEPASAPAGLARMTALDDEMGLPDEPTPLSPNVSAPAVPPGMKPWHGGDNAPVDWDGGRVLLAHSGLSSGGALVPGWEWAGSDERRYSDLLDWRHGQPGRVDIVAYTPVTSLLVQFGTPDGWALVPVEPTEQMLAMGYGLSDLMVNYGTHDWREEMKTAWSVMLGEAPTHSPLPTWEEGEAFARFLVAHYLKDSDYPWLHANHMALMQMARACINHGAALARPRAAVGEREALIAELLPLIEKAAGPNGWDWMFPLLVKPVDGKPTIVSHKGGNLFRGYIGTWQEADLLVAFANAAPRIILALQSPPAKVEG